MPFSHSRPGWVVLFTAVMVIILNVPSISQGSLAPRALEMEPREDFSRQVPQAFPKIDLNGSMDAALVSLLTYSTEGISEAVPLVIFLRDQPTPKVAAELRPAFSKLLDLRGTDPGGQVVPPSHDMLAFSWKLKRAASQVRSEIIERAWPEMELSRSDLVTELESLGVDVVHRGRLINSLTVRAPLEAVSEIARNPAVARIYLDYPLEGGLSISASSMGANEWWSQQLNGSPWDVAIVDTGIDFTHPYLTEGPAAVFHDMGRFDRYYNDRPDLTDDFSGHGTHVAGIVASQNLTYRGVAFGVRSLVNAKFAWRSITGGSNGYWSDAMEAIDWAIADAGADVISFSFGANVNGDGESGFSRYLDAVVDYLGVPVVVGVMNLGPDDSTVAMPSDAYNVISVGNMDDRGTEERGDDVLHLASGRGPTEDGRIKPDLVAPGTSIASTSHRWSPDNLFENKSGTSMATPHVAASVSLLLSFFMEAAFPALLKALLINSADDQGLPGVDFDHGWGYVNMSRALMDRQNYIVANLSSDGSFKLYELELGGGDRVTLAWQRHVLAQGFESTDLFLNLDLEAYDPNTQGLLGLSDSTVDNVEQLSLEGTPRPTVLKVKGDIPPGVEERFALAASGPIQEVRPPEVEVELISPCAVRTGDMVQVEASISNKGELSVQNLVLSLEVAEGLILLQGNLDTELPSIRAGGREAVRWTFRAASEGEWGLRVGVSGSAFGEALSSAAEETILVQLASKPIIKQLRTVPEIQGIGEEVAFEATACAGAGISEVRWIFLSVDGSEVTNVSMGFDEERRVYALHRTFWSLGVQRFRIAAVDWGGSWVSAEATFTIVDSRPPDILEATVLPSVNELGASMTLRARILDNSTLASVSAGIWHWSGSTEDNITLQLAGSGYWEAVVVPKEAGNYIVSIWAIDVQGNAAVKGLQFRVFRGSPPVAEITAPTQTYPEQLVTISGGLSADDFGIESFTWTIEGPDGTVTLDGSVINYVFEETGTYRVILVVRDRAGNLDSDERQIRVRERPVQMPLPPIYLFILSVAVTLLVLWLWLVRRRAR